MQLQFVCANQKMQKLGHKNFSKVRTIPLSDHAKRRDRIKQERFRQNEKISSTKGRCKKDGDKIIKRRKRHADRAVTLNKSNLTRAMRKRFPNQAKTFPRRVD